ncbi:MAG: winged helix-turn-helix transcriptional regulator [Phaeodactylibacter sp.]|nr:winged helix-turn-helix transcriptional regulator [Phaeodactylibacter sp.]
MKHILLVILSLGLFSGLSFVNFTAKASEADKRFPDQANLAIRQVGHQLLKLAGDERSAVPLVQITGPGEFTLELESSFNYDTLPQLLNQAFLSYDIHRDYQVVVKRCNDNILILGYNQAAFARDEVPCIGREQWSECNNIVITFRGPPTFFARIQWVLIPLLVLIALVMTGGAIFWKKNKPIVSSSSVSGSVIPLGHFSFDHQNQILRLGGQQQTLTFRENKLLYFLANNANEVVKRELLIAEVWGDEGVIVGRSLDVFISRLRKLLKGDKTVTIRNIHSVGYRLEVMED